MILASSCQTLEYSLEAHMCVHTNKDKMPSEYATLLFKARLFIMPSISTFAEGRPKYCDILDSMTPSSLLLSWRLTNHASSKRP